MSEIKKGLPEIKPMEQYEAPKVPTLTEVYKNPEPLKKLPKRWLKNASVVAGVSVLGLSTLAGCMDSNSRMHNGGTYTSNEYGVGYNGYEEFDLVMRIHHGGAGRAHYVVHLTEQEALGIIRSRLEAVGLDFADAPPDITASPAEFWLPDVGLDLFDAANNVAISHLDWGMSSMPFTSAEWVAREAAEHIAQQTDINVGVFFTNRFNPEISPMPGSRLSRWVVAEAKAEARPILAEQLDAQIETFIQLLRDEGIVE